jgi:hypothetical protein
MRTLFALTLCATLASLSGCMLDGAEAAQVRPIAPVAESAHGGHEIHKMFAEEKSRAKASELPAQF